MCIGKNVAPADAPAIKWNILGSATPSPLNNIVPTIYLAFVDVITLFNQHHKWRYEQNDYTSRRCCAV